MEDILKLSSLNSETALKLVTAGRAYAIEQGWQVAIAVADQAGNMIAYSQVDGAPPLCAVIAQDKACTAANFKISTRELAENLEGEAPRVTAGLVNYSKLVLFGGGVPVTVSGETIGAVGVSGSSEKGDEACGQAAINKVFGEMINV